MIGRRNGSGEDFGRQIEALRREIAAAERTGPPLEDRIAQNEAELTRAEQHFRGHGFVSYGRTPDERSHYQLFALRGAVMAANREAILGAERDRITRRYAGTLGLISDEKRQRLAELHAQLRPLLARREFAWRAEEARGVAVTRSSSVDAEMYLAADSALTAIACGKEAA